MSKQRAADSFAEIRAHQERLAAERSAAIAGPGPLIGMDFGSKPSEPVIAMMVPTADGGWILEFFDQVNRQMAEAFGITSVPATVANRQDTAAEDR